MPTDPDDQPWRYARGSDPETSRRAAESLNHKIKGEHLACMQVLLNFEVATDEMVADELVRLGIVKKSEQGRRLMRTIRENNDYARLVEIDGKPMTLPNESGRDAQCYELTMRGVQMVLDPKSRRIA
jgi:hypothetical protein